MADKLVKCFNYVADKNSKVLILGTLPPCDRSFYYEKDNLFWKILGEVLNCNNLQEFSNEAKKDFLKENEIALWDIFKSGYRKDALSKDSAIMIETVKINNLNNLLKNYSNIKHIIINGKNQAYEWFQEYFPDVDLSIVKNLYSTGTINRLEKELKEKAIKEWKDVLNEYLNISEKSKPKAFVIKKNKNV